MTEISWFFLTVIGPMLLMAALAWAFWLGRFDRPGTRERSEEGARQLQREIERDSYRMN